MELRTRDELCWSSIFGIKKGICSQSKMLSDLVLDKCVPSKRKTKTSKLGKRKCFI